VTERDLPSRIIRRAGRVGVNVDLVLAGALGGYLDLLRRWNRKINLTGLDVESPADEAIDRLVVEPLAAAKSLLASDQLIIDVGSGGGSPAIPLKLAVPRLRVILVEAKVRKSAFLREAVRQLALSNLDVENGRFEELVSRADLHEAADVITLRAVRVDGGVMKGLQGLLRPSGRVFWFGSGRTQGLSPALSVQSTTVLIPALGSQMAILTRSAH
jgi:16S rRNA (guanine527-N7)-methyltransferase